MVTRYLAAKLSEVNGGELSKRHFLDLKRQGLRFLETMGRLRPAVEMGPPEWAALRAAIAEGNGPAGGPQGPAGPGSPSNGPVGPTEARRPKPVSPPPVGTCRGTALVREASFAEF